MITISDASRSDRPCCRLPQSRPVIAEAVEELGENHLARYHLAQTCNLARLQWPCSEDRREGSEARSNSRCQQTPAPSGCLLAPVKVVIQILRQINGHLPQSASGTSLAMLSKAAMKLGALFEGPRRVSFSRSSSSFKPSRTHRRTDGGHF